MDRWTLRDWVHRYNEQGLSGLSNQVPPWWETASVGRADPGSGAMGPRRPEPC